MTPESRPDYSYLLQLKRWNTPTIYNGWEQITQHDNCKNFNIDEAVDYMPEMGPSVGYAITAVIEPSNGKHKENAGNKWIEYLEYVSSVPGPKIVVVQDLDKPQVIGSWWGEINSNIHRSLGCVGTITDGAIRDVDEMKNAGFHALARRLCVGHAHAMAIDWNCPVEVFGCEVQPGQLIHMDKHGFLAIPDDDIHDLLEASKFMDTNECDTFLRLVRDSSGMSKNELLQKLLEAKQQFGQASIEKFKKAGEF